MTIAFPKHCCMTINHNPYAGDYISLEKWIENMFSSAEASGFTRDETIHPDDLAAILLSGEVWTIDWCPNTPVSSRLVIAATFERAIERANEP